MRRYRFLYLFLLAFVLLAIPATSHAQVRIGVSVRIGPPPLPVYAQPYCPGPGYIWTPGYWAYGDDGYYWVPGTWVMAPEPGLLWTPGYWGWGDGVYIWHRGYWGRHVGFYGGINYGFGYPGVGFFGGEWRGREFFYNRDVNRVDGRFIHNVYDRRVDNRFDRDRDRVSFNGGRGGVNARPNREQEFADHDRHFYATRDQVEHRDAARGNRAQWASQNHGRPGIAATQRPGQFNGRGVVRAGRPGAPYRGNGGQPNRGNYRPNDRGYNQPPNRGNYRPNNRGNNQPDRGNYRPNNRGYNQPPNRNNQPNRGYNQPTNRGGNRDNQMRPGGPGRPNNGRPNNDRPNQNNHRRPPPKKPHGPGGDGHRPR